MKKVAIVPSSSSSPYSTTPATSSGCGWEMSSMEKLLESDLVVLLMMLLGFKDSITKLSLLNKTGCTAVLNQYLMYTKINPSPLPRTMKRTVETVLLALPSVASTRLICQILDAARTIAYDMQVVSISTQAREAVRLAGTIHGLRSTPEFTIEMSRLNESVYTCWHGLPLNHREGIYDLALKRFPPEDVAFHQAMIRDGFYWQGCRLYDSFVVLFDRPDGTIVVSRDLKSVFLVLGLEQTLGKLANIGNNKGEIVKCAPFKAPQFHGPLLGTRITMTLLNWEGKIIYDGLLISEPKPHPIVVTTAVAAYINAVNTNTLISSFEQKKAGCVLKFQGFDSQAEFDRVLMESRPFIEDINAYKMLPPYADYGTWIAARHGSTVEENPNLLMCMDDGSPNSLVYKFQMDAIIPPISDYMQLIYYCVLKCKYKPHYVSVDARERVEMLRGLLEPMTGIKVLYFPPPSDVERKQVREDIELGPKCAICSMPTSLTGGPLMTCSRCGSVRYCCKEHQRQDWKQHKEYCNVPAEGIRKS